VRDGQVERLLRFCRIEFQLITGDSSHFVTPLSAVKRLLTVPQCCLRPGGTAACSQGWNPWNPTPHQQAPEGRRNPSSLRDSCEYHESRGFTPGYHQPPLRGEYHSRHNRRPRAFRPPSAHSPGMPFVRLALHHVVARVDGDRHHRRPRVVRHHLPVPQVVGTGREQGLAPLPFLLFWVGRVRFEKRYRIKAAPTPA
jgi:hypothetical protein